MGVLIWWGANLMGGLFDGGACLAGCLFGGVLVWQGAYLMWCSFDGGENTRAKLTLAFSHV